jgi:hypothetical protein
MSTFKTSSTVVFRTTTLSRTASVFCLLSIMSITVSNAQELLKCESNSGKISYQSTPCESTDKSTTIRSVPSPESVNASESTRSNSSKINRSADNGASSDRALLKTMQTDRRRKELNDNVETSMQRISRFRKQFDNDLSSLKAKKNSANNNLAGATFEQSISTEMQATVASYETRIRFEENKLLQFREELKMLAQ